MTPQHSAAEQPAQQTGQAAQHNGQSAPQTQEPAHKRRASTTGAYPAAAAAFAAGLVYLWGEAGFRLAFQYSPSFDARWVLWNGRVGDIAAMWLTISGVAAVTGVALYLAWRGRERVGSLAGWMIGTPQDQHHRPPYPYAPGVPADSRDFPSS
jgi:hypothetical protein